MSSLALPHTQPSIVYAFDGPPFDAPHPLKYTLSAEPQSLMEDVVSPPLTHDARCTPTLSTLPDANGPKLACGLDHSLPSRALDTGRPVLFGNDTSPSIDYLATPNEPTFALRFDHDEAALPMRLSPCILNVASAYFKPPMFESLDPAKLLPACKLIDNQTDPTPHSITGPPAFPIISRNPSSMALRRFASNRPFLQRKVDLPPVPSFAPDPRPSNIPASASLLTPVPAPSPLPLSLRQFSFALSKTRSASASPVTPIHQIMPTTPLSPPSLANNCRPLSRPTTRKLMLSAPLRTVPQADLTLESLLRSPVLGLGLDFPGMCGDMKYPPPISELGLLLLDKSDSASEGKLPVPCPSFPLPAPCAMHDRVVGISKASRLLPTMIDSCSEPDPSPAFLHARAHPHLRLSLPRRLSYSHSGISGSPGCGTPTPMRADRELASPAVIDIQLAPAGLPSRLTQRTYPHRAPNSQAHLPRMAELESYF